MAATAYNLKKLLKFITTKAEAGVGVMTPGLALKSASRWPFGPCLWPVTAQNRKTGKKPAFEKSFQTHHLFSESR